MEHFKTNAEQKRVNWSQSPTITPSEIKQFILSEFNKWKETYAEITKSVDLLEYYYLNDIISEDIFELSLIKPSVFKSAIASFAHDLHIQNA